MEHRQRAQEHIIRAVPHGPGVVEALLHHLAVGGRSSLRNPGGARGVDDHHVVIVPRLHWLHQFGRAARNESRPRLYFQPYTAPAVCGRFAGVSAFAFTSDNDSPQLGQFPHPLGLGHLLQNRPRTINQQDTCTGILERKQELTPPIPRVHPNGDAPCRSERIEQHNQFGAVLSCDGATVSPAQSSPPERRCRPAHEVVGLLVRPTLALADNGGFVRATHCGVREHRVQRNPRAIPRAGGAPHAPQVINPTLVVPHRPHLPLRGIRLLGPLSVRRP
ncbi:MAG: hypothetical protein BWY79_01064 [Actinobacteria bacterium ADurb.Bin444]|nr:MAG: hypothetical protein BWY79_01064 [Actinobacteria bacterium ADurb.Bin444]